jgi:hypothetical protein
LLLLLLPPQAVVSPHHQHDACRLCLLHLLRHSLAQNAGLQQQQQQHQGQYKSFRCSSAGQCGAQRTPGAAQKHMGDFPRTADAFVADPDSAAAACPPDQKNSHQEALLLLLLLLRKLPATGCAYRWHGLLLLVCLLLLLFLLLGRASPLSSLPAAQQQELLLSSQQAHHNRSNVDLHLPAQLPSGVASFDQT